MGELYYGNPFKCVSFLEKSAENRYIICSLLKLSEFENSRDTTNQKHFFSHSK